MAEDGAILDAEFSPARFIVEKRDGAVTLHDPSFWSPDSGANTMTQRTPPSLMEGIKQGIEAAGQALLEETCAARAGPLRLFGVVRSFLSMPMAGFCRNRRRRMRRTDMRR